MKAIQIIISLMLLMVCVSCKPDSSYRPAPAHAETNLYKLSEVELAPGSYHPQYVAFIVFMRYIDVSDDLYVFTLTPENAEQLRMSPADYNAFVESVTETNAYLAEQNAKADMAPINEAIEMYFPYGSADIIDLAPLKSNSSMFNFN